MNFSFWVPKEEGNPARWDVVGAEESKLTVRIHYGEVTFKFQDADTFTLDLPESAKMSGKISFKRTGSQKE